MGNSLPFSYVPLLCFKMRQLLLQKEKELSEYKAIGMIQDHLSLLYQAVQKDTRDNKGSNPPVYPTTEKWTEISSIREKDSL